MNTTQSPLEASFSIHDYYVAGSLSGIFALTAVVISVSILILVRRTKPRLHTVRHLLMCNTCVASILYCIVEIINYVFLIFLRWETSDVDCRWRGYFAYVTICGVAYSYFAQAISRLFISVLSTKYRWLTTFKTHYILILVQWFVVMVITLPAIVTKDIYFRPTSLCWVPLKHLIHVVYTYLAYYILPALTISMIYAFIYYRVRRATARAGALVRTTNNNKRDLELLRNILILLGIYLLGGIPSILFLITTNKIIYLIGIVSISLTVTIEKVCTILLDRDIRQVAKTLIASSTRVIPIERTLTVERGLHNLNPSQLPPH